MPCCATDPVKDLKKVVLDPKQTKHVLAIDRKRDAKVDHAMVRLYIKMENKRIEALIPRNGSPPRFNALAEISRVNRW